MLLVLSTNLREEDGDFVKFIVTLSVGLRSHFWVDLSQTFMVRVSESLVVGLFWTYKIIFEKIVVNQLLFLSQFYWRKINAPGGEMSIKTSILLLGGD